MVKEVVIKWKRDGDNFRLLRIKQKRSTFEVGSNFIQQKGSYWRCLTGKSVWKTVKSLN